MSAGLLDEGVKVLPYPPRSNSPPLPPRKNAHGLPPTYLRHLRALLHQWLNQQLEPSDGLLRPVVRPLWDAGRLAEIQNAIWEGAVLGKDGLLAMDWNAWSIGSAKRKKAWREEKIQRDELDSPGASARGRQGKLQDSARTTPSRASTRTSSIASSSGEEHAGRGHKKICEKEEKDLEEVEEEWARYLAGMPGFERYSSKKDDWEVIAGELYWAT